MAATMYFGTKGNMQYVPCPRIDQAAGKTDWSTATKQLNGGNYTRRSAAAAREYTMTWGLRTQSELAPIIDYADGLYGGGYIYFLDPFIMARNVLPTFWSNPYLNTLDGPLTGSTRPVATDHLTGTNGYPTRSGGVTGTHSIYIPVPTGYTLNVGIHVQSGVTAGGTMRVWTVAGAVRTGTVVTLTNLTTASTTRTNATFAGGATTGYEIENNGDMLYTGMIAQVRPTGQAVPTGGFISGQGHSGMRFLRQPEFYQYSAPNDKVRAGAVLIEEEAWA